LGDERRRLSLLRRLYEQKSPGDRWRPVLERLLGVVAERVDAFGGDSTAVPPSPYEDGNRKLQAGEQWRRELAEGKRKLLCEREAATP